MMSTSITPGNRCVTLLTCFANWVSDQSDNSHWHLSSISEHWQNREFYDWVSLIGLLRYNWLAMQRRDPSRAARIAEHWFDIPYPTFKRLALFATSIEGCIGAEQ